MPGTVTYTLTNPLDVDTITSLYLYGQPTVPTNYCDRIRDPATAATVVVNIDTSSFMDTGPGRYAVAAFSTFVQNFFGNQLSAAVQAFVQQAFV